MRLQTPAWWVVGVALLLGVASAAGQGTFQNLAFESGSPGPTSPNTVSFDAAFPGWTGYMAGIQQTTALYNRVALDTSAISLIDQGWSSYLGSAGVIEGRYTAVLQAGLGLSSGTPANVAISQTALVPAASQSLRFEAYGPGSVSTALPLFVMLGGQRLSFIPLGSGSNYTLYGADIHTLAGQSAELAFTVPAEDPHLNNNYVFLDAIQFSNLPIPEPSAFGLSVLGALLLGWRALKQRQ
jgi:hypothetical protein